VHCSSTVGRRTVLTSPRNGGLGPLPPCRSDDGFDGRAWLHSTTNRQCRCQANFSRHAWLHGLRIHAADELLASTGVSDHRAGRRRMASYAATRLRAQVASVASLTADCLAQLDRPTRLHGGVDARG
jgi:hypothetical protein